MESGLDITAIILAGGQSSRMGADKGLVMLGDKAFIAHIIDAVSPLVKEIIIVSQNADYDKFGCRRVEDSIKNVGPIGGIYTGLLETSTETNLVLSCDVPLISKEVLVYLIKRNKADVEVLQYKTRENTLPLIALYKKRCIVKCKEYLDKNERRLQQLILGLQTKTIELPERFEKYTRNINSLEELNEIRNEGEY
jgi:molybdopterin-guanine dinucleotide biosynthesis protein A